MSDVEQADDDIVENPEPEADFRGGVAINNEVNINLNDEVLCDADENVEEEQIVIDCEGEINNASVDGSGIDDSLAEGDQSDQLQDQWKIDDRTSPQNSLAEGDQHNVPSDLGTCNIDTSKQDNEEEHLDISNNNESDHDDLAAEDEQYFRDNEVNFAGAEWSLEPEENSQNYVSDTDIAFVSESAEAVESDQVRNNVESMNADQTESSTELTIGAYAESKVSVSNLNNKVNPNISLQDHYHDEAEGATSNGDGQNQELLLAAEEDRNLQMERETTEADQEMGPDFRISQRLDDEEKSVIIEDSNMEIHENSVRNVPSSLNQDCINVLPCNSVRHILEDEIGSLALRETAPMTTSESYQPECDQTAVKENENNSSPQMLHSDKASPLSNESMEQGIDEMETRSSNNDTGHDKITSRHSEISNNSFSREKDKLSDEPACDSESISTENNGSPATVNQGCDNVTEFKPNRVLKVEEIALNSSKGAIPKQRQSSQPVQNPANLSTSHTKGMVLNSGQGNSIHKTEPQYKQYNDPSMNNEVEDAEDALLSELDATLQADSISNVTKAITNSSVPETDLTDHQDESCEQCKQNNTKCSFITSKGDHSNIPAFKEIKKQLHQAKNLLLERECQISRLKDDLQEQEERYTTVMLEKESCGKELECLKAQSSDDLYIPQIKELEYTIAQQQNEIRSWKDKLASHDTSAKRAITTLQNEMKLRLDQMTKNCDDANKEKDSMVVKYAQAEHKNLEYQKQAERAESKLKEMEKERDAFLLKMKAVKEQRTKLGGEVEARNSEINNLNKELDKQRELVSSADVRVKWSQNKLKAELEAHKDTKGQLEKMTVKLKEAKEETQQIRADCQAIIKTYQESEEVKSNSLDKELKQKETELLVNQQEKTNWELAHVKTQRELEHVKGELRDSKSQCVNLTEKLSSLEVSLSQSTSTVDKYGEIIQKQKKEIQELRERIETLVQYRTDFTRSQELIKTLDTEIAELKISNKDLVAEMDACKKREMDKLELTEKLTQKNVELQSENSTLANKVLVLTGDLQSITMEYQGTDVKLKDLTDSLNTEQKLRQEETQILNTKLAGKCKAVEDLSRRLDEEKDEIKTLKRKHTNNIRDLTRQLQLVRRKLETYEASTNGDKDTVSMGSRTSSNGSLNINEQPNTQVVQPNSAAAPTTNAVQNHTVPEQEYPVITEQVEVDKQILIERIVKLQRALARKNEKLEFMDDHISQLVDEIQKKNKIIQSYILKEEAGTMTSDFRDRTKAEISRKHSIMGSVYSSHSNDGTMTLDLSLEINRKLQAVLEDTLLKNMTLKDSIDTLGQEIARLSQENRQLQLKLQGMPKSRGKGNPPVR